MEFLGIPSQQNHQIYEFGPFHLDAKRVLLKEGEPQKLFPKEFDILLALVERIGELLGKDDLMRTGWARCHRIEESNLATNISHLRKILGGTRDKKAYIVTIPGRGYRFVAGVTQGRKRLPSGLMS